MIHPTGGSIRRVILAGQDNPLSTGLAPAAFKGYADTATGTCGQDWTTDPGNSSDPPPSLSGTTVPVVVSSTITQTGSVISGDTSEVVLVQFDPGYEGDPGHPGTETVISVLCDGSGGGPAT